MHIFFARLFSIMLHSICMRNDCARRCYVTAIPRLRVLSSVTVILHTGRKRSSPTIAFSGEAGLTLLLENLPNSLEQVKLWHASDTNAALDDGSVEMTAQTAFWVPVSKLELHADLDVALLGLSASALAAIAECEQLRLVALDYRERDLQGQVEVLSDYEATYDDMNPWLDNSSL